jgi:Gpi18-like mannosyltransferase
MMMVRKPASPLPSIALTLGVALVMAWVTMPTVTTDMPAYLLPWFDHIVATGPVASFEQPFSNYAPAYLYLLAGLSLLSGVLPAIVLIKLLSVAGTVVLALAVRHLLIRFDAPQPVRAAALVFAMPSLLLNATLLGQCDAMWAAPCIMGVAAALDRRHATMLAWFGLAVAFKAQAVLVAPFFLALLIKRKVPLWLWPIAPAVTLATMVPAWAAGWPAADLVTIYLRQADTFQLLSFNAPNIWAILQALPLGLPLVGLATAAAIGGTAAYIARFSAQTLDNRALLSAALLATLVTAGLLPRMHERYFFLADVLALCLALVCRDRPSQTIAILVQAGSTLALLGYLSGLTGFVTLGAAAMIVATVKLAVPLLKPAVNDNPLMARAI